VRLTPETVMTCPATEAVPVEAVMYPAWPEVREGAVQPDGTVTEMDPPTRPPLAAV
jgi:hypothetical protein